MKSELEKLSEEAENADNRESIEAILKKVYVRKDIVWKEINALTKIHTKLEESRSEIDSVRLFPTDDNITIEKVMGLNWKKVEGKLYDRIIDWFRKFKYVNNSGYVVITKQVNIQVSFCANEPIEPQIATILPFIPHIKPYNKISSPELCKHIDIMEHTCARNGVFCIYIEQDNKATIVKIIHGRTKIIAKFKNIELCLQYVYKNHPYELSKEEHEKA